MFDFLQRSAELVGHVMVILAAAGGLWVIIKKPWRWMAAWLDRANASIAQVSVMSKALGSNGGSSLGDMIRSIDVTTTEFGVRINWLCDQMDRPNFECDAQGLNARINAKFTDQLGYSPIEMLGNRWIRLVHPEDRDRVLDEWNHALADVRIFESVYRAVTRAGVVIRVRVTAEPFLHPVTGRVVRWMGRVETLAPVDTPKKEE